jgi:uncharacterized protein YcbK (DUF882 family)
MKLISKLAKILFILIITILLVFFLYFNNTSLVNEQTVSFYKTLKDSLRSRNLSPQLLVVSTKRFKFHNKLQVKFSGAATKSKHRTSDAIDFIVFDINKDGISDSQDVDIVYYILDKIIIKSKGGIGTYKNESSFFYRQMIHINCRGYRARWK